MLLVEKQVDQRGNFMRIVLRNKKGDWSKTEKWLEKAKNLKQARTVLEEYGRKGVAALSAATPVDTGETASSWSYEIIQNDEYITLTFVNNNKTITGIPIPILLQYGHGNGVGGYVQGRDFINPVIQPIFEEIANKAWKEIVG